MELYSMLCGSLDGRGVWGRIKTWHVWLCVFAVHLKLSQHCQSAAVAAAAAAKWLQSCPTLCDPMDSSPPGSSVHGILQASAIPQYKTKSLKVKTNKKFYFPFFHVTLLRHELKPYSHKIQLYMFQLREMVIEAPLTFTLHIL